MSTFFIVANSFAAPLISDVSYHYVDADTPQGAVEAFLLTYSHPFKLYSAAVFSGADPYHRGEKPFLFWLSNHELARRAAVQNKPSYSYLGHCPGKFEIDHVLHTIDNSYGGEIVEV